MTNLINVRNGVEATVLNNLSNLIRSGISANLPEEYRAPINILTITDTNDVFGQTVGSLDDLIKVWGQIIKASGLGLTINITPRADDIKLQIYTIGQFDLEDVIIDGVTTRQYLNRRGGELLLNVIYQRSKQTLTYNKFWG